MKKFTLPAVFAAFLFFSIVSSCKKDTPDLASNLIGTYTGAFVDSSAGANYDSTGQSLIITKIDNQTVQISPVNNSIIPFSATVSTASNGYTITIPQQTINGVSIVGNPNYNANASVNGALFGNSFASSIVINYNGSTVVQTFVGTKQ